MGGGRGFLYFLRRNKNFILAYAIPLILLSVFLWESKRPLKYKSLYKPQSGAFIMLLMASYWVTECIPLSVTSLLPVLLVPLMGIADSDAVTVKYFSQTILFLLGGCLMSLAFEYSRLNVRLALLVVSTVGAQIPLILLGLMFVTMFLSMFCSNTSTTSNNRLVLSMVIPIGVRYRVIVDEFQKKMVPEDPNDPSHLSALKAVDNLKHLFYIAVAYAANIGGTGIPTGTGTNVISLDQLSTFQQEVRDGGNQVVNRMQYVSILDFPFTSWVGFNIIPMILNVVLTWLYLLIHFLKLPSWMRFWRKPTEAEVKKFQAEKEAVTAVRWEMKRQYAELGRITFHELTVGLLFIFLIILWVCREPKIFPGWGDTTYGVSYIKDATPTLLVCLLIYILPNKTKYYKAFFTGGFGPGIRDVLMRWDFTEKNIPWSPFLLLGGGSAMAVAAKN